MNFFYVYLIISKRKNKYITYVGYTNNINNRLKLHNTSKGAKFTKGGVWFLAYLAKYLSKNIAMKEEYLLKHDKKKRYIIKNNFLNNENFNSITV
jgi:putative endonuclease